MTEHLENPVPELLDTFVFNKLQELGLINSNEVRNLLIRQMYKKNRETMNTGESIEKILEKYPYLQFDSVKRIIYKGK